MDRDWGPDAVDGVVPHGKGQDTVPLRATDFFVLLAGAASYGADVSPNPKLTKLP